MLSMLTHLISFNFVAWVILTLLLSMLLMVVYYIFVGVVRLVLPLISHLFFIWLGDIIGSLVCSPSLRLCYARAILVRICIICNFDPLSLLKYIYPHQSINPHPTTKASSRGTCRGAVTRDPQPRQKPSFMPARLRTCARSCHSASAGAHAHAALQWRMLLA